MSGSLNDILPDPISEENERILLSLLKRKMQGAASLTVRLLHAMEDRFGPEVREVVRDLAKNPTITPRQDVGKPEEDLRDFCSNLDRACVGSHQWERVIDESDRVAYNYTRCVWSQIYRELGEPELGIVLCASDEPAVRSYNPKLAFRRTKVLMNGDEVCDHVFYVDKQ